MEQINAILSRFRQSLKPGERQLLAVPVIRSAWAGIVGKRLKSVARPSRMQGKSLLIAVREPGLTAELQTLASSIRDRCNKALGEEAVAEIVFFDDPSHARGRTRTGKPEPMELPEQMGLHIRDPVLRECFRKACAAYLSASEAGGGGNSD